jgi:predicted DNA-binding transcriptional regulator YafY
VRVGKEKTVAEIEMPDDNDLILKILSLGNGVKAVSPDSLRNKLLRHAESLVQLYKD